MSVSELRSVLLATQPITSATQSDCLKLLVGPLPQRVCGFLRMGYVYNSSVSKDFLCMRIERLAWPSGESKVVESKLLVCKAVSICQPLSDRDDYLKHCIEMLAHRLPFGATLDTIDLAISAMVKDWDLLGIFLALENLPKMVS